jgi:peptidoglycan/xylan/chitin deacetylase (PgdA/CDA1 family)
MAMANGRGCGLAAGLLLLAAQLFAPPARAEGVALTFDDLPSLSLANDTSYMEATNAKLIAGLKAHRAPAIGFVIGDKVEGPDTAARLALIEAWLKAGLELGNHTYSHGSLNKTALTQYIGDVARDDAVLRPLMAKHHRHPAWFRHPYLETGATLADKRTFEAWLKAEGYSVAPVTLENSDWMFAMPYDAAIRSGNAAEAARVRKAYLDYTAVVVPWYRKAALQLLGRSPALVFLLHETRLNADSLDDLLAILKRNGLTVVSLDRAMADPAYRISDDLADANGDEWLSRWSMTLKRELPWASFQEPPADIAAADQRLDPNP